MCPFSVSCTGFSQSLASSPLTRPESSCHGQSSQIASPKALLYPLWLLVQSVLHSDLPAGLYQLSLTF